MKRSASLLTALLARDAMPRSRIARALDCVENDLVPLAIGETPMPLGMQMRLAALVIAETPPLARQGHALKAQVEAATSFQMRETGEPARQGWPKERVRVR